MFDLRTVRVTDKKKQIEMAREMIKEVIVQTGTKAPRQPWHDLHCRIDGPAAYDVLINFEQRWKKSSRWREFSILKKRIAHWSDDSMIKIERISWILSPAISVRKDGKYTVVPDDDPTLHVSKEDHPENWHVQIFRSIDSSSVKGFPKTVDVAQAQHNAEPEAVDLLMETLFVASWSNDTRVKKGFPALCCSSCFMKLTDSYSKRFYGKIHTFIIRSEGFHRLECQSSYNFLGSCDRLFIVDFYSPGCGGCKALHPKVEDLHLLLEHVDKTNYGRTCLYLTSSAR